MCADIFLTPPGGSDFVFSGPPSIFSTIRSQGWSGGGLVVVCQIVNSVPLFSVPQQEMPDLAAPPPDVVFLCFHDARMVL